MATEPKPVRTPKMTREQWEEAFENYIAGLHISLYSRSFSSATPKERKACAQWMANAVMGAAENVGH